MKIRCGWFVFVMLIASPFFVDLTPMAEAAKWTTTRTVAPVAKGSDVGACAMASMCAGLAVETKTKTRLVKVRGNDRGTCSPAKAVCN